MPEHLDPHAHAELDDEVARARVSCGATPSHRARRAWAALAALPVAIGLACHVLLPVGWDYGLGAALLVGLLVATWTVVALGRVVFVARRRGARAAGHVLAAIVLVLASLRATSELPVAWRAGPSSRFLLWRAGPTASPHVLADTRFARRMLVQEDAALATATHGTLTLRGRAQPYARGTTERGRERGKAVEPYSLVHFIADGWWYVVLEGEGW